MKLDIQKFADGSVVIETKIETKTFDAQIAELEYKLEGLEAEFEIASNQADFPEEEVKKYAREIEQTKNKIISLQKQQLALNNVTNEYGSNIGKTITKIGKMGLAIFGVRTAYQTILSTANKLAQENDEIANKMSTIRNALTNLLAPAVEVIINLVYKLLAYINVITKSLLGVDLFKKSAKSLKGASSSAQKLRKTLAGFDEMNILSDTSSAGGGIGGGNENLDLPDTTKFQETIEEYKQMWSDLLDINRAEMAEMLLEQDSTWGLLKLGWFDTIQGIARIVSGFVGVFKGVGQLILGIVNGDKEQIQKGALTLVESIGNLLLGLFQTILGLGEMIVGAVYGFGKSIGEFVYNNLIKTIIDRFKAMWDLLVSGAKQSWNGIKNVFSSVATFFKTTFSNAWNGIKALFSQGGQIFNGMKDGVVNSFKAIVNALINGINKAIATPFNAINKLLNKIHNVDVLGVKPFSSLWSTNPLKVPKIPKLAKGGIINMPGRGVPLAIGGEHHAEGVIPLTDSQQMALLGEAIGRYITINANITNTMNGRIISRELQKIQDENSFASNR